MFVNLKFLGLIFPLAFQFFQYGEVIAKQTRPITGETLSEFIVKSASSRGVYLEPVLSDKRTFRNCNGKLSVNPSDTGWNTAIISCQANKEAWSIAVRNILKNTYSGRTGSAYSGQNHAIEKIGKHHRRNRLSKRDLIKVIRFSKPLRQGKNVSENDIYLETVNLRGSGNSYTSKSDVIGRKLRRSVGRGTMASPAHFHRRWSLYKGDIVKLTKNSGKISVSVEGRVLSNAQIGDILLVKNVISEKIVRGIVINQKKVKVIAKQN
tara:strand:- start:1004 stop:1798 length:795 start_codon:yes stop_codon:yes gene_type:complete